MTIGVVNKKLLKSFYKKSLLFGLILVFFSSSLISISQLFIGSANADSLSGKVINAETVEGPDKQLYFLSNGLCKSSYYPSGKSCLGLPKDVDYSKPENCFNYIAFTKKSAFTDNTWYYHESRYIQPSADGRNPGTCEKKDKNGSWIPSGSGTFFAPTINMQNTDQLYTIYSWINSNVISRTNTTIDDDNIPENGYTRSGITNEFQENGVGCPDIINVDNSNPSKGSYVARTAQRGEEQAISWNSDGKFVYENADQDSGAGCYATKSIGINIAYPENSKKPQPTDAACQTATDAEKAKMGCPSDTTTTDNNKDSGCSQALTPFGWILCPIANVADNILSWYEGIIQNILYINPSVFANGSALQQVWRIFSNLASALIVLIALAMIAGQIFNFEIFSAYTVKKVLPRLVIGAILIQLSWFLCGTLIQLVNAIGTGIYWLILAPLNFGDTGTGNNFIEFTQVINYSGNGEAREIAGGGTSVFLNGLGIGATVAGGAAGAAIAITSGAWVMIIVAAIGVIISLIVGIVTLMIRVMLIVILIVLAPLAIAAWILPGTQNFWNMWWKMFSRLLMMFPLIMLLFAGGVLAGAIMASAKFGGGGADVIANFAIVVAYFAPIFMISMTYKFAGTAFSSIATIGNKLGDKASGSGLFGLRDRAKFAKENSSWAQAKKNREGEKTRAAHSKYGERIGGDSRYGKFLLRRASSSQDGQARLKAAAEKAHFDERMKESADLLDYQTSLGSMTAPDSANEYLEIFKAPTGSKVNIRTGKKDAAGMDIMQTVIATEHLQRQAVDRIAQTQQISQLREAQKHAKAQGKSSLSQSIMQSTLNKNYAPIKDKAPDIVNSGLHTVDAAKMTAWDASTWDNWQKQYKNRLVFPPETQSALEAQANDLASNENIILNDLARKALDNIGHTGRP